MLFFALVVKEGKTRDQIVQTIGTVCRVVTVEFGNGKHGQTSVLQFLELALVEHFGIQSGLANFKVSQRKDAALALVINLNRANGHKDLRPAQSGDGRNGIQTIGHVGEFHSICDFSRKTDAFLCNITENGQLRDAAVLEFRQTVFVKRGLVNFLGQAKGVCSCFNRVKRV
jgi:hypothetical protein